MTSLIHLKIRRNDYELDRFSHLRPSGILQEIKTKKICNFFSKQPPLLIKGKDSKKKKLQKPLY